MKIQSRKSKVNLLLAAFAVLLLAPVVGFAQAQQQDPQQNNQSDTSSSQAAPKPDEKPNDSASQKSQATAPLSHEEARQAQFVADSQKLYQLAQELKAEVAKSNKNMLSIAVTKKAEEIEKLAKSLKERMRKE
jgi:cytoskeletal protein RodZ